MNYLAAGALRAGGDESASNLINRDPEVASGFHSEIVKYSDIGPLVFKLDTIEVSTEGRTKIPIMMIRFMLLIGWITMVACLPLVKLFLLCTRPTF